MIIAAKKLISAADQPRWLTVGLVAYTIMAGFMLHGWFSDPRETFYLIMAALFTGWAGENALKLAFPRGHLAGAAMLPSVLVMVACTYLYSRDGHIAYGAIMVLGLLGFIGGALMMAAWGKASKVPENAS